MQIRLRKVFLCKPSFSEPMTILDYWTSFFSVTRQISIPITIGDIRTEIRRVPREMLDRVITNFNVWVATAIQVQGAWIKHELSCAWKKWCTRKNSLHTKVTCQSVRPTKKLRIVFLITSWYFIKNWYIFLDPSVFWKTRDVSGFQHIG